MSPKKRNKTKTIQCISQSIKSITFTRNVPRKISFFEFEFKSKIFPAFYNTECIVVMFWLYTPEYTHCLLTCMMAKMLQLMTKMQTEFLIKTLKHPVNSESWYSLFHWKIQIWKTKRPKIDLVWKLSSATTSKLERNKLVILTI